MIRILFIDSSQKNFDILKQHILPLSNYEVVSVANIESALLFLKTRKIDLVIFTLTHISPNDPLIQELLQTTAAFLIQGTEDQKPFVHSWIEAGAQDFFSLNEISFSSFSHLVTQSLARQKYLNQLQALCLTDELTQSYNRRGFDLLINQQIEIAKRMRRSFILFSIDVDALKKINDEYGHLVGDIALKDTAHLLHQTFRIYDIIGRIGGDEFMICAIDAKKEQQSLLKEKLKKNLQLFRKKEKRPFILSFSIGSTVYNPDFPVTKEALYEEADRSLYESKRSFRSFR